MSNLKEDFSPKERVYLAFYNSKKQRMYFNEIREKANMSISSLQNAISKLEKTGEMEKSKEKSNTFYTLKNEEMIGLNFARFDIHKLNNLNVNVKMPLKEFLEQVQGVAFIILFGSSSIGAEKKGSDIDMLVVLYNFGNEKLNGIYQKEAKDKIGQIKKRVDAKSLYPLSLVFIDEQEFKTRRDYLLDEAKKTGFCIYNQQYYYRENLGI